MTHGDRCQTGRGQAAPARIGRSYGFRLALAIAERLEIGRLTIELAGIAIVSKALSLARADICGCIACARCGASPPAARWASPRPISMAIGTAPICRACSRCWRSTRPALADRYYGRRGFGWIPRVLHLLRPNTRRGSRRNIFAHYDLGNGFYRAWLDETMTYSAARFATPDQPLEDAQRHKYASARPEPAARTAGPCAGDRLRLGRLRRVRRRRDRRPGHRGHDLPAAARLCRGAHRKKPAWASGSTSSSRTIATSRAATPASPRSRCSRPSASATGRCSSRKLRERLAPGGRAGLQVITIADRYFDGYRRRADFIQRHIFPGGMLPSPGVLAPADPARGPAAAARGHLRPRLRPHAGRVAPALPARLAGAARAGLR